MNRVNVRPARIIYQDPSRIPPKKRIAYNGGSSWTEPERASQQPVTPVKGDNFMKSKGTGSGGAGRGQGRKKGSPNRRSSALFKEAIQSGTTPLELMLAIMRTPYPGKGASVAELLAWRAKTLEAAKMAAPYCHARLTAMTNPLDPSKPPASNVNVNISFIDDSDEGGEDSGD